MQLHATPSNFAVTPLLVSSKLGNKHELSTPILLAQLVCDAQRLLQGQHAGLQKAWAPLRQALLRCAADVLGCAVAVHWDNLLAIILTQVLPARIRDSIDVERARPARREVRSHGQIVFAAVLLLPFHSIEQDFPGTSHGTEGDAHCQVVTGPQAEGRGLAQALGNAPRQWAYARGGVHPTIVRVGLCLQLILLSVGNEDSEFSTVEVILRSTGPGHELYRLLLLTHKLMGDGNAFQCLVHGCGADGGQHTGLAVPQHPADTACHGLGRRLLARSDEPHVRRFHGGLHRKWRTRWVPPLVRRSGDGQQQIALLLAP
mmetsp:Transcript_49963/g.83776  ORF Transcript_49963/g.83776 Transcript_49963/m.83776 type:complete len:316 (-) Transcript_49963:329-1276(-)